MSFLRRWRDRRGVSQLRPATHVRPYRPSPPASELGFVIIDTETTGLSAHDHRIIELAVLRADAWGRVTHEWVCRFNPEGPVGATHIHGIREADVVSAPLFRDVLPDISRCLTGAAVVGHNVRFDMAFLRAEYRRAGWALPFLPSLCTLDLSYTYFPALARRRLADCCWAAGVPLQGAHSALYDARAAAALLSRFLDPRFGPPLRDHHALCAEAQAIAWPAAPGGVRSAPRVPDRVQRRIASPRQAPRLVELLDRLRLHDVLEEGAAKAALPYLEMLAEALEDGELTDDEATALAGLASVYDLSESDLDAAHRGFLLALAHLAADDGKISRAERDELVAVATLLRIDQRLVRSVLDAADAAREARLSEGLHPLPPEWPLGEPLRVGQKVAFTGCDDAVRDALEARAERLDVRVMGNVSRQTTMLVSDGSFSGTKAADAAALGTRVVTPEQFTTLLRYLQPALPREGAPVRRAPAEASPAPAAVVPDPAVVRRWARDNGMPIGVRGRLPLDVVKAYEAAVAG